MTHPRPAHLTPTHAAGAAYFTRARRGPAVMLNLLRFRVVADYAASPELAPDTPISGRAAYDLYIQHTLPFLEEAGSRVLFAGEGGAFLIGPDDERWDVALLVEHQSQEAFLTFASNQAYLAGAGHRTAALADSRLLPLTPSTTPVGEAAGLDA